MWILTNIYKKHYKLGSIDWGSPRAPHIEKGAPILLAEGGKKYNVNLVKRQPRFVTASFI